MRAQAIVEYGQTLQAHEQPTPAPQGSEVLLRVRHCGVCHSDVHLHDGYFDLGGGNKLDVRAGRKLPFALGHEIEGAVEAAGPEAAGVAAGQRFVAFPWIGCGACAICARGDEHLCTRPRALGITVGGGYATHVMVPHPRYLIDYGAVSPALAGTYMCSGLTAYAALRKIGKAGKDDPIAIVGLGGVGMMGLTFAKALFPDAPAIAVDVDPAKRETALKAGAAQALDPKDGGALKGLVASGGAFAAIDFVGSESSMAFATGAARKGGAVVVVGLFGGAFSMPIPFFPMRAISIGGSYVGSLAEARAMMELVKAGKVAPIPVSERPLEAASASLDDLRAGKVIGRVVLTP